MIYDQERMMYRTLKGELLDTRERHITYIKSFQEPNADAIFIKELKKDIK